MVYEKFLNYDFKLNIRLLVDQLVDRSVAHEIKRRNRKYQSQNSMTELIDSTNDKKNSTL